MFTYLDVSSNLTRSTLYFFSLTNPKNLKMGKTIKQWLEELPQGYRERALKNFKGRSSINIYPTMASALCAAFIWSSTEEKHDFWLAVHSHYLYGYPLPELLNNKTKTMEKGKLIGYRFVKEQYLESAKVIMTNNGKDDMNDKFYFNIDMDRRGYPNSLPLDCRAVRYLREAGVLDLWFEPIYVKPEIVHSVGGKFDVTIKDGDIYHCDTIITDYVKAIKEFSDNAPTQFHGFTFSIKDIILNQTGCEIKETSIRDWLNLYQVWKDNS